MRKLSRLLPSFTLALAASFCSFPAAAQQAQFLVHEASGKCVDVSGAPGVNNGATLQLWDCETQGNRDNRSATDQKWYLQNGFIRNGLSGKCVDVRGAPGVAPGTPLQLWECETGGVTKNNAQSDQLWDHASGQLNNRLSRNCIAPASTDYRNGTPLVLMQCQGAGNQTFSFRTPGGQARPAVATAPAASAGKPSMIYPDVSGGSQSCVIPVDERSGRFKIDAGSKLVLTNCKPEQGQIFMPSGNRISVVNRPDLCVNVAGGRTAGSLYLEACKDTAVKAWDISGTSTTSARIRAVGGHWDNQCWAVPDLTSNKRFPFDVASVTCKGGNRDLKFFVERT